MGLKPGERVCIFMDRIPSLYISFLGVLKFGAVVQPLFSAFGEESLEVRLQNAETSAILTTQKHVKKVRRLREKLPALKHVIVVDGDPAKVGDDEIYFDMESSPVESFEAARTGPRHAVGAPLHLRHHRPAQGRASTCTGRSGRRRSRPPGCSTCSRTTSTGAPPTPAG